MLGAQASSPAVCDKGSPEIKEAVPLSAFVESDANRYSFPTEREDRWTKRLALISRRLVLSNTRTKGFAKSVRRSELSGYISEPVRNAMQHSVVTVRLINTLPNTLIQVDIR